MTPAAERALAAATRWAGGFGETSLRPFHLLLALLDEEEGRAAEIIGRAGMTPAAARALLAPHVPAETLPSGSTLPHTTETESTLLRARELAMESSVERTIATEHLLLALLQADLDLARTLSAGGLDLSALEKQILQNEILDLRVEEPVGQGPAPDEIAVARILDVAANRAREALRVLEDYARFALDDAVLCGELKRLRHELADVLSAIPSEVLLAARETLRDVGTTISTAREQQRYVLADVVQANAKRLQEALRTLEEFGKLRGADLGQRLEALRYRAYTVERALLLGAAARRRLEDIRLCVLVSGASCAASLEWTIQEAAAGGAGMIQLREKNLSDKELLERARRVRVATRKAGVLFIVNDRPDLARLVEADGVHLGLDDMLVKDARRIMGPDALIGVSTHTPEQVQQAILDGASYLGVGPTFSSGTKQFEELAGLEFVRQAAALTALPAFVIGGINPQTVAEAVAAGARRIAVSQAVCQADDPRAVAAALLQTVTSVV